MVDYKGQLSPITNKIKDNIKQIAKKLNKDGLRVIAVCQKNDLRDTTMFNIDDEKIKEKESLLYFGRVSDWKIVVE